MFSPLGNVDLIPIQIVNKCPKENAPNHQEIWGGPGGGLPEYPGFHLKEAILVPIVLLAVLWCNTAPRKVRTLTCIAIHMK